MSNRKSLFHLRSLPPTVAALAVVGLSGSALAQVGNPTTGATLYKTPVAIPNGVPLACENCHGAANIFNIREGTDAAAIVGRMSAAIAAPGNGKSMNQYAVWTPQMRADVASYIASATSAAPPPPPLTLPPGTPAPAPAPAPDAGTAEHDADDEPGRRPLQQYRDRQGKRDQRRARDQQHVGRGQVRDAGLRAAGRQAQRIRLDDRAAGQHQLRPGLHDWSQVPAARSGFALPRWRRECARRRGRSSSKTTFRRATSHWKVRRSPARPPRRAPMTPRTVAEARSVSARSSVLSGSPPWVDCAAASASNSLPPTRREHALPRRVFISASRVRVIAGAVGPEFDRKPRSVFEHRHTYAASIDKMIGAASEDDDDTRAPRGSYGERSKMGVGHGPERGRRRQLRLCGAHDRRFLPALVRVTPCASGERRVFRQRGRREAGRLSSLQALSS